MRAGQQLIVVGNRLAQPRQDLFDTAGLGWLLATDIEVVDHAGNASQPGLVQGKTVLQGFEGHPAADMAERRAIEVEPQRIGRAIRRGVQPEDAPGGIDEASDQPGAGQTIDPGPFARRPDPPLIIAAAEQRDRQLLARRLVRRERAAEGAFQLLQRRVHLWPGFAGEEIDSRQMGQGFAQLADPPGGLECVVRTELGATVLDIRPQPGVFLATLEQLDEALTLGISHRQQIGRAVDRADIALDRLQRLVLSSQRTQQHGALLFIDLDNFKDLNDTLGHDMGDQLLSQVATRLVGSVREADTVARFGGDEFVVMLETLAPDLQDAATQAETVAEKLLASLNQPFELDGAQHYSTPSIGITLFGDERLSVDELLKRADLAMYQAKAAGRNTQRFFDPDMQAAVNARSNLEADLRQGLARGELLVHYQPVVDHQSQLMGAEALVRWRHPQRGMISPADFIPLAEQTGLILPLGQTVLHTACSQLAAWAQNPATAHLTLSVNVSARQFRQAGFVAQVLGTLKDCQADPHRLKLELTESLLLGDIEDTIARMVQLKSEGVGFALDDFGTGYSSLSYLKRLPLDQVKIDQSFVRDVLTDPNDAAIVRTILALATSLDLQVVAEGVETTGQLGFLRLHGCEAFQGYLFGRPGPVEDIDAYLQPVR